MNLFRNVYTQAKHALGAAYRVTKGAALAALGTVTGLVTMAVGTAQPANATIDVTTALSGVTDAQTAILAVIGALMTLATTLFGIMMVYKFLHKKSGV